MCFPDVLLIIIVCVCLILLLAGGLSLFLLKRRCKKTQGTNAVKAKLDAKMFLTSVFLYVHIHTFIICPTIDSVSSDQRNTRDDDEVKLNLQCLSISMTAVFPKQCSTTLALSYRCNKKIL